MSDSQLATGHIHHSQLHPFKISNDVDVVITMQTANNVNQERPTITEL